MSVINIKDLVNRFHWNSSGWPWSFDPFLELASRPRPEIYISTEGFSFNRRSRLTQFWSKENITFATLDQIGDTIESGESVVLSIDEEMCFVHQIEVPKLPQRKIPSILQFELTKTTPFEKEAVYTGWVKGSATPRVKLQDITHFVIRRDLFRPSVQALAERGIGVLAIVVRQANGAVAPFALSIDNKEYAIDRARSWLMSMFVSLAVIIISLIFFIGSILSSQEKILTFVEDSSVVFNQEALLVREKTNDLESNLSEMNALIEKRTSTLRSSAVIEELSKTLPDSSYLDGVSISGDSITIDGAADNPEELIALLESSTFFGSVKFNTPSFRNPGEAKSRFSIAMQSNAEGVRQ